MGTVAEKRTARQGASRNILVAVANQPGGDDSDEVFSSGLNDDDMVPRVNGARPVDVGGRAGWCCTICVEAGDSLIIAVEWKLALSWWVRGCLGFVVVEIDPPWRVELTLFSKFGTTKV